MRQENREKEGRRGLSLEGAPEEAGADREQGEPSFEEREAMQLENIVRSGAVITRRGDLCIHTVTVIGQIEGHYQLGDGQKSTLIAPDWSKKKFVVMNEIDKYLSKHNSMQGILYK